VTAAAVVPVPPRQEPVSDTPPMAALVPLGHGIPVVRGGAARSAPVETCLFASGRAEVADVIAEGVDVAVLR
jgi:hypothetical protein